MLHFTQIAKRAAAAAFLFICGVSLAPARDAVVAKSFMVSAAHPLAVEAGYEVLKRGGSAVDAAVAVQVVLGLVEPQSSGIGGGAFLLHWSEAEKKLRSYDGRETAPAAARADRFLRPDGKPMDFFDAVVGGRSVGVPGVIRMLELAHQRHGRLAWSELFGPAIRAAEEGFALSPRLHASLGRERFLQQDPAARRLFFNAAGKPKAIGARITNAEYAKTLRAIAQGGARQFYEGDIARDIVHSVRRHSKAGDLSENDLLSYRAVEREPVCGPYRAYRVCSMAPPSSGGMALVQMLGLLERTPFASAAPHSARAVHLFSEAGRLAFADRARYVGDPDFAPIPIRKLTSKAYLDRRASLIGERSMRIAPEGDAEAPGTSHFSILAANGDVVSMTTTVESPFGSRVMVRGFLLNNQLTDFDFVPGRPNQVGPRKRPRSSMAPTVVFSSGSRVELVIGSPGGPAIINYVAKSLVAALDWKLGIQAAIDSPNFGSRNGPTELERGTRYEALRGELLDRGHQVVTLPLVSGLHGIERVPGGWRGGADSRREGIARGD